jgi:two-component sensor histidine kinase
MSGAEAPVDVLVVDAVAERHNLYRDLLAGFAGRVVAVEPGATARQLYSEGGFAATLVRFEGATDDSAAAHLAAMSAVSDASSGPPVIVISERMPDLAALGASFDTVDYLPDSFVSELLVSRISCLLEIRRLKGELVRRDTLLEELSREVDRATAAAAEERQTSDLLRARLGEQMHRSKNLLAIMQSITHRTISDGRRIPEVRDALLGRLRALSRAYHLVAQADGKGVEINEVVEAELADVHHRVTTSGPHVRLAASVVQTFLLAIHELAANAKKYGALGESSNGSVMLGWTFFEYGADRYLEVAWTERGVAPKAPPQYGFGLTLVSSFAGTRGSAPNIIFGEDGLLCRMRLSQEVIVAG